MLTLLGMELSGKKISSLHHGAESFPVFTFECDEIRISRADIVGVNEVEMSSIRGISQDFALLGGLGRVPAHVRHLIAVGEIKLDNLPGQNS